MTTIDIHEFPKQSAMLWYCAAFINHDGKMVEAIVGVFDNVEAANKYAKLISQSYPYYDFVIGELYKWHILDLSGDIKDINYHDEQLNEIMKSYMKEHDDNKVRFQERKNDFVKNLLKDKNVKKLSDDKFKSVEDEVHDAKNKLDDLKKSRKS